MNSIKGVAFITDLDWTLLDVIQDDIGLFRTAESRDRIVTRFSPGSLPKLENLNDRLREEKRSAFFRQVLVVRHGTRDVEMEFHLVCLEPEKVLWSGRRAERDERRYYDGLMRMNNENINELRKLLKEESNTADSIGNNLPFYDDLTKMNNELATIQRTLAKKTHELESSNERKNQVIGMVAHDLRNPLSVILNFAEFLLDEAEDFTEQQVMFIREIQASSRLMLSIVEELVDISAIEAGRVTLNRERLDVGEWIELSANLYRGRAEQKGIQLDIVVPEESVWCHLDSNKIRQIVNNLVSNAIKFSHGGTHVTVVFEKRGEEMILRVQDQGQGIPTHELEKLFIPFGNVSVKSTDGEKSTGLGLAITKKLVQAHGGDIRVKSQPGKGSEFEVKIPCESGASDMERKREEDGSSSSSFSSMDSHVR
ncbi:MAG: HAMP domain-containing sensor histidine kinase [Balneolaceae bacterium]